MNPQDDNPDEYPILPSPRLYLGGYHPLSDPVESAPAQVADTASAAPAGVDYMPYPAPPKLLGYQPAPTYQRDERQGRTGAILAAIGALLGGRADLAGSFGASYLKGNRVGADQRLSRDTAKWGQDRQIDAQTNADLLRNNAAEVARINSINGQRDREAMRQRQSVLDANRTELEDRKWKQKLATDRFNQDLALRRIDAMMQRAGAGTESARMSAFGKILSNPYASPDLKARIVSEILPGIAGQQPVPAVPQAAPTAPQPAAPSGPLVPYLPGQAPGAPSVAQSAPATAPPPLFLSKTPAQEDNLKVQREKLRQGGVNTSLRAKGLAQREQQSNQRAGLTREQMAAAAQRQKDAANAAAARQKAAQQFQAEQNKTYRKPAAPDTGELTTAQKAAALKQHSEILKRKQDAIAKQNKKGVDNANAELGAFYNIYPELKLGGSGFSKPRTSSAPAAKTAPAAKPKAAPAKGKTIKVGGSTYEVIR